MPLIVTPSSDSKIDAIDNRVQNLEQQQQDVSSTLENHETRIEALESSNPEQLRGLTDTNFGTLPNPAKDQYTVKYDNTSDKFLLLPDNSGMPEAPIDGLLYSRKDEAWETNIIQSEAPADFNVYG